MKKTSKLKLALGLVAGITAAIWGIMGNKEDSIKNNDTSSDDVPTQIGKSRQNIQQVTKRNHQRHLRPNHTSVQQRMAEMRQLINGVDKNTLSKKEMVGQVKHLMQRAGFGKNEFTIDKKGHDPDVLSEGLYTEKQLKKNPHAVTEMMRDNSKVVEKITQLGLLGLDGSDISVHIRLCNDTSCVFSSFAMTPDGKLRFSSVLEAGELMDKETLVKKLIKMKSDKAKSDNKTSQNRPTDEYSEDIVDDEE